MNSENNILRKIQGGFQLAVNSDPNGKRISGNVEIEGKARERKIELKVEGGDLKP